MSSFAWALWIAPLLDHLWQSTVFAGGVWILSLALRRNAACIRYRLWFVASLKFLVPFSLLMALGARLPWSVHLERTQPAIAVAVAGVARPLLQAWPADSASNLPLIATRTNAAVAPASKNWLPFVLLVVWAAGVLLLLGRWMTSGLRLRSVVRRGQPVVLADGTPARVTAENVEPGVFGILRPVLVLPRGIAERLSAEQMHAIVAHELCHIRRKDNLTAALHMAVEALFWIHPLVWWLQSRLVAERERACDEAVLDATRQPFAYAEGILNVCKFYVETPLSCVSGVTGAELKQRIARILFGQAVRRLDVRRKVLLALACLLAIGVPVTTGLVHAAQGQMQPSPPSPADKSGIVGTWQGTAHLPNGRDARMVLKIAKGEKGGLSGTLYRIDANGQPNNVFPGEPPIAASSVSFEGGTLRFVNNFPGLTYEGKMSADENSISGTMTQNASFPLLLERATPETEWTIPAPPLRIPPMDPNAKPGVEVATIKPTAPGTQRFMFRVRGGELDVANQTLSDLIKFAYGVQNRQIEAGPAWMESDRWDIEAKPDTPGTPSNAQLREMLQRLLADRFALKVHEVKKEMPAYVLAVDKDGPKLTRSTGGPSLGGFTMGPLGVMHGGSATMGDFAHILENGILDRPVADQTGLQGKWDFTLKWTPDESQFVGMPVKVPPPPADDSSAPPPLFTAIREQLGLQLKSEKAEVPVVVVDHAEKPTAN